MRREYLMLADNFVGVANLSEWMGSEKLDGMRAFWDGGYGRGKEVKYSAKREIGTGLWSRYGNVINAPDSFLDKLPLIPLDGELYLERRSFQTLMSIVKRDVPDARWDRVKYMVFDSPNLRAFTQTGLVKNANCEITFDATTEIRGSSMDHQEWMKTYLELSKMAAAGSLGRATLHEHWPAEDYQDRLVKICAGGGEGVILRRRNSYWTPKRSRDLLKVKKVDFDSGIVKGYEPGKGKYTGVMGSVVVEWRGLLFNVSGFTDAERINPPTIGSTLRFCYRELSDAGIPKEARYVR